MLFNCNIYRYGSAGHQWRKKSFRGWKRHGVKCRGIAVKKSPTRLQRGARYVERGVLSWLFLYTQIEYRKGDPERKQGAQRKQTSYVRDTFRFCFFIRLVGCLGGFSARDLHNFEPISQKAVSPISCRDVKESPGRRIIWLKGHIEKGEPYCHSMPDQIEHSVQKTIAIE